MFFPIKKIGQQGTWIKALSLFFSPLLIVFLIRWLFFEPFVIPSESMMPNLLIHDHVLVLKYSYGIKAPFGDGWVYKKTEPQRGDIVVFRYPKNRDVFFIKRLIGLPGDRIKIQNGRITINNTPWVVQIVRPEDLAESLAEADDFSYYSETVSINPIHPSEAHIKPSSHLIRFVKPENQELTFDEFIVPAHSYFVMGDNRDQSHDSRFWGYVDEKYLIGRAAYIWLSCSETILMAPMICDPLKIRPERMFKKVENL